MGSTSMDWAPAVAGETRQAAASAKRGAERNLSNARIALDTDQLREVELRRGDSLLRLEVLANDVPDGLALHAFGHRRPARDLVGLARFDGLAPEAQVADAIAHLRPRRAGVGEPADAHHVPALLVIGIGIEEVVADVLEDRLHHLARDVVQRRLRIGDRR